MDTITIDMETYYDQAYSLSKLQTDAYVDDPRFEAIGAAIGKEDGAMQWFTGRELPHVFSLIPWDNVAVRAHHAQFDGMILAARYGVRPAQWKDTLAQGRMLYPHLRSHSLANMAKAMSLPAKGDYVAKAMGKRLDDFTPDELRAYGEYCLLDAALCRTMGQLMDQRTPPLHEYLIDMTVRMFTEPALVGDVVLMEQLYNDELVRKAQLMSGALVGKDVIMSAAKFAAALEELGVAPPRKISARTGKETWAFAKTDRAFTDLQEHEDSRVQALVAARLGGKSTIAETRAHRFWKKSERGPLRVYLGFWGAKTTGRYSGGNLENWQNLPARGPAAGIRRAIGAPAGYKVVVGDSSNIELRTVMMLAGQTDVLDKIRAGVDLYCDFASRLFGRPITKADKAERQLGKVAMLSLQYGAGAARFQEMVRIESTKNPDVKPITLDRAQEVVTLYRAVHNRVVALWRHCNDVVLPAIARREFGLAVDVNGLFITQNDGFGRPGEPGVMYHDLQYDAKAMEWSYQMGKERVRIFGPKVVENLSQHAAMLVVMWQTARINRRYPVKLSVHDEAGTVVRDEDAAAAEAYTLECLSKAPPWCADLLPVMGETGVGQTYADAK